MVTGEFSAPQAAQTGSPSYPEALAGTKAYIQSLNDAGGINGKKIDLDVCDDQGDANTATGCSRTAVSNKDVAVLAPITFLGNSFLPTLEQAGLPYIPAEPNLPDELTSPDSFPIGGGAPTGFGATGAAMAKAGCKKVVAIRLDYASTPQSAKLFTTGAKLAGAQAGADVVTAATTADYAPAVATAKQEGADCLATIENTTDVLKIFIAAQQAGGFKYIGGADAELSEASLKQLGPSADGKVLLCSPYLPLSDSSDPAIAAFLAGMKKYQPSAPIDADTLQGWVDGVVFGNVAKTISGDVTKESFLAAIKNQTALTTGGLAAPIDYSKNGPVPGSPRLFNTKQHTWISQGEKFTLANNDLIDVAPTWEKVGSS